MIFPHKYRLRARNEGKLKSYESCTDLRAWSHDCRKRDSYLREWIRSDMTQCAVPTCGLLRLLGILSSNSRGKLTPRCHVDCKSRILLETICNSCQAMKQCLKDDPYFEKYFIEEEFETSHWPCDRCLEALKSIKLFWKVIVEKVLQINITKKDNGLFEENRSFRPDSLRHVAQSWQRDIVHQALFVKTCNPPLNSKTCSRTPLSSDYRKPILLHSSSSRSELTCTCRKPFITSLNTSRHNCSGNKSTALGSTSCRTRPCLTKTTISSKNCDFKTPDNGDGCSILSPRNTSKNTRTISSVKSQRNRVTISDLVSCSTYDCDKPPRTKHCTRCISVRVRSIDVGCDPCQVDTENAEVKACKINLEYLQKNYDVQRSEIDELKKENNFLKVQLQKVNKVCKKKSYNCIGAEYSVAIVPKPLECCVELNDIKNSSLTKNIESEMYITMQKCKNKSFRHVSLLQVLHKTNEPILDDIKLEGVFYKKENPINLLTKVQDTLGAIIRREMSIAGSKRQVGKRFEIDATFQSAVNTSKSAPSFNNLLSSLITLNEGNQCDEIPAA